MFAWLKTGRLARPTNPHRVVVVGGGFGGVYAVKALKRVRADVTLLDRRNFHLFQPLLYQVATGALSPANIAEPLRAMFERRRDVRVLLGEVSDIAPDRGCLMLSDGTEVGYDSLIVACGSTDSYFGNDHWADDAPPLKSVEDATEMRRRIYMAFERAERTEDVLERQRLLTFVIVGAGPTGTELAGAVAEISRITLKKEFRRIDSGDATIVLVQSRDRVLNTFPEDLSDEAADDLRELGVIVRTECRVVDVQDDHVKLKVKPTGTVESIPCNTVLWAAGVQAASLTGVVAERCGIELDRGGRVPVEPDCSVPGHPDIFVVGDAMSLTGYGPDGDQPLPGVAQVAIQQGKYVARLIAARLKGPEHVANVGPFEYLDLGNMATIGKRRAIAETPLFNMHGRLAWLAWLFVHLMNIIPFHSRLLVMIQWGWSYFTNERSARLITETPAVVTRRFERKQLDAAPARQSA